MNYVLLHHSALRMAPDGARMQRSDTGRSFIEK